ncbi:unnamed protein product [Mytilus edulis]|uniref:Uncharacterized protein n=1 Tax=Mytilus edulis TaxID=6550 RepID=A0A8S3Q713_MYTED|nr:unnamed protein product [Mytilus edulis]
MNLKNRHLSLTFYNYLCDIVGSEEVVRTRRDIFTVKDIVDNTTGITFISSGSKAEGLDLKGSDYDQMILHNGVRVYESLNDDQSNPDTIPLVMVTNDTKPGFTKIKLVSKSYLDTDGIHDWHEAVGEETYISSKRCREHHLRDDMVIHGPCQSTSDGEYDHAKCFRCKEWITPAQQWIHRSRDNKGKVNALRDLEITTSEWPVQYHLGLRHDLQKYRPAGQYCYCYGYNTDCQPFCSTGFLLTS